MIQLIGSHNAGNCSYLEDAIFIKEGDTLPLVFQKTILIEHLRSLGFRGGYNEREVECHHNEVFYIIEFGPDRISARTEDLWDNLIQFRILKDMKIATVDGILKLLGWRGKGI
jgi:hypothetical protein